jgi:hypothetical protein
VSTVRLPLAVTGWLAGPPELADEPVLLDAVLSDLLALLRSYPIGSIYTSEPRYYRPTARGRALLAEALAARRVDQIILATPAHPPSEGAHDDASASLLPWAAHRHPDTAVQVHLGIRPAQREALRTTAVEVTDFVTKWFVLFRAAAAFVSVSGYHGDRLIDDSPMVTGFEREPNRAIVWGWAEVCRYARGAFWGMGLGPDLCARLGGAERVLRQAPVAITRPLGKGVWLQTSEAPPAEPDDLERLAEFLVPLLDWSVSDLQALRATAQAEWRARTPLAATLEAASLQRSGNDAAMTPHPHMAQAAERAPTATGSAHGGPRTVPIRGLREAEVDAAVNIHLAAPPTPEQLATLLSLLGAWYAEGFDGAWPSGFGVGGFHSMSDPVCDDRIVRFQMDFGSADGGRALRVLARRLAALSSPEVRRIVLGTESVG